MPERRTPVLALLVLLIAAALGLAAPARAAEGDRAGGGNAVAQAAPPVESCGPGRTERAGEFTVCRDNPGGGGAGGLLSLLPIVGVVVVAGIAVLLGAFFVIERRNRRQLAPVDPGEWWTCRNCGRTNVVGSPRCYACGTWQG